MTAGQGDIARRLGAWAAGLRPGAVPADAMAAAIRCLVDATGVALAGRDRPAAAGALAVARARGSAGVCRLIGRAEALGPAGAALANAAAIHALDFDDTSYAGTLHATAVVWPAALAAAELADASGGHALTAFVAGAEVAYALGRAFGNAAYDRGWWTTALLGTVGAAAGAARALGLNGATAGHAVALAAAQAFGTRAVMGSAAKPYLCGQAAAAGLEAALAARAGIDGPERPIESGFGLAALAGAPAADWGAVDAIGRRYALVDPGIAVKQYPVCSSAQAAAQAMATLRADHALDAAQVARVDCAVAPMVAECLPFPAPRTVGQAQFSLPFAVGCILAYGRLTPGELAEAALADPRLRQAMAKVSMAVDPALAAGERDRRERPEACVVTAVLADGRRLARRVDAALGMPADPMPDAAIDAKFLSCAAASGVDPPAAAALLARLRGLARLPAIRRLFDPQREESHAHAPVGT